MDLVRDVLLWVGGVALIVMVVDAAVRTFVLPRGAVVRLTRLIAVGVRAVFDLRLRFCRTYEHGDRVMAMYSPLVLLAFVTVWLAMLMGAFTMIFLAVDGDGFTDALTTAGSSLFTLGFERPPTTIGVDRGLRCCRVRARTRRAVDRLSPDPVRRVLTARSARRLHGGAGRHPGPPGRTAGPCAAHRAVGGSRRSLGTRRKSGSRNWRRPTRRCRCSVSSGRRRRTGRGSLRRARCSTPPR